MKGNAMKTTFAKSMLLVSLTLGISAQTFAADDDVDYTNAAFFGNPKVMTTETKHTAALKSNAFDSISDWRRPNDASPAVANFSKSRETNRHGSVSNPLVTIGIEHNR